MSKTLRAIIREGKIEPLEQVDLPEGSKVLVHGSSLLLAFRRLVRLYKKLERKIYKKTTSVFGV
jgi:predicted DNA-binding antitoxin AbrB/MazE fold protein